MSWHDDFTRKMRVSVDSCSRGIALTGILTVGTLIRLSRVWYGEGYVPKFSGDLISDLKHAHELLGGDYQWLYLGPALPGGWLPSFLYVSPLALSTRICGSPSAFTLAVVLLNVVGLLACYYSIRLLYPEHPAVAMVSMLMQAVFPYPVNWSINHLHTNLIIPFSCFAFYGLCLWVREQRAIGVAIAGISISLLLQFHLVGIFLLPLLPLLYVLYRPPINRRVVAAALLPFVLFYGGYLIFDGFNHFKNTLGLIEAILLETRSPDPGVLRVFFNALIVGSSEISNFLPTGGFQIDLLAPGALAAFAAETGRGWAAFSDFHSRMTGSVVIGLFMSLLHLGFIVCSARYMILKCLGGIRSVGLLTWLKMDPTTGIICLWVVVPSGFFLLTGNGHHTRYALILFPVVCSMQVAYWRSLSLGTWSGRFGKVLFPLVLLFAGCMTVGHSLYLGHQLRHPNVFYASLPNLRNIGALIQEDREPHARVEIERVGIEDKFRTQNLKALALYLSIFESPDNSIKSTYTVLAEPFYPSRGRFRQIGRYRGLKVYRKLEDSP